jgi:hypothetical protein
MEFNEKELYRIAPYPIYGGLNGQFKAKFYSAHGQTKCLNITNEQFKLIERLLSNCNPDLIKEKLK